MLTYRLPLDLKDNGTIIPALLRKAWWQRVDALRNVKVEFIHSVALQIWPMQKKDSLRRTSTYWLAILNPRVWTLEFFTQAKAVWLHWEPRVFCVVIDLPFLGGLEHENLPRQNGSQLGQIRQMGTGPSIWLNFQLQNRSCFLQNRSRVLQTLFCSSSRRTKNPGCKREPWDSPFNRFPWRCEKLWQVDTKGVDGPSSSRALLAMLAVEAECDSLSTKSYHWDDSTCKACAYWTCISCCTGAWGVSPQTWSVTGERQGQRLPLPVGGPGAQVPTLVRDGTQSNNKIYRTRKVPCRLQCFTVWDVISACLFNCCVNNILIGLNMYSAYSM